MSEFDIEIENETDLKDETDTFVSDDRVDPVATDAYSVNARQKIREQLQADMEAFLTRGGHVTQVADNVRADPPRKPSTDYGSAPI